MNLSITTPPENIHLIGVAPITQYAHLRYKNRTL